MDNSKKPKGLLKRYAGKAIDVVTRPLSKKVELYNDPNWKNPPPVKKKGLVRRVAERVSDQVLEGSKLLGGDRYVFNKDKKQ